MNSITVSEAARLLEKEEVVAVPTETVYGLAGRIDSPKAIEKIFNTKKRPSFDPLIVHVKDIKQAKSCAREWNELHQLLAEKFWPGSLTLILPKAENISDVITAGLDTVGLRCPNHEVTLDLLSQVSAPVAAPSANMFSKTSPTTALHVLTEFDGKVAVIDGGPCAVGLESTICRITHFQMEDKICELQILRRGAVLPEDIKVWLEENQWSVFLRVGGDKVITPGQLKVHYRPQAPLVIVKSEFINKDQTVNELSKKYDASKVAWLGLHDKPELAARQLYSQLRTLGDAPTSLLICHWKPEWKDEFWLTIFDRLSRAAEEII